MGMDYLYIPIPIGLFIFLCAVCARLAKKDGRPRRRLIIVRRTIQIPSQFESGNSPIIISEEGYDQRPDDFPPTYEDAQRYHQWQQLQQQQQQQGLQHPPQQGAYVKVMQGWNHQPQQQQQPAGGIVGAPPAQVNPQPPGLMQPGVVTETGGVAGNNGVAVNNGIVSTGMLLDVTSLPCASAQSQGPPPQSPPSQSPLPQSPSPPSQTANES